VRDLFRSLDPNEQQTNRLGPNIDPARLLAMRGDAERGRKIFFEQSGTGLCARCHLINGKGTDFGPDLSHIATKYSRPDLLDNVLSPSKTIAEGYTTFNLQTKSGDLFTGFLVGKNDQEVVLKDATLKLVHVPASDVQKLSPQALSAMPEGLLGDLEAQQAVDLLDYLCTLK
jgi:putative heme-binding domain-containing protein